MEELLFSVLPQKIGKMLSDNEVFTGGLFLVVTGFLAAYLHWGAQLLWEQVQRLFIVSLEVRKEDEGFQWIMQWLAHQTEQKNGRELSLLTSRQDRYDRHQGSEAANKPQLHFGPAPGIHFLRYKGRLISVERVIKEQSFGSGGGNNGLELNETVKLTTYGRNPQIFKDLAEEAMNFALGEELGRTLIFQPKYGWGGTWRKLMAIDKRTLKSVHFREGILEELLADVKEFFSVKEWYKRRGIPHRRGILLYGPPGNGKSTFATALAGELGLNLCICSLSNSSMDDDELQESLRKMPKESILLLEDIDAAFVHRAKGEENKNKVTFSGLLNALDGAVAYEGSLVLMTTNHKEKLDPALTRPGRIDISLHIGMATQDQIRRLFSYFYMPWESKDEATIKKEQKQVERMASEFAVLFPDETISMASIQGFLLRYKKDPQAAIDHVEKFIVKEKQRMQEETVKKQEGIESQQPTSTAA